jgi:peptidyl-prolyl cis-trans isomerase SurA
MRGLAIVRVGRIGLTALVVCFVASALSACSPSQLGAAAMVDDQRITVSEIQGTLKSVRDLQSRYGMKPSDSPTAARDEVQRRIVDLIFDRAAGDMGVGVSPGEISTAIDAEHKRAGGDTGFAQEFARANLSLASVDEVFRMQLLDRKMIQKLTAANLGSSSDQVTAKLLGDLSSAAKVMRIKVNPRYGTFDVQAGQINPTVYDFLRPAQ